MQNRHLDKLISIEISLSAAGIVAILPHLKRLDFYTNLHDIPSIDELTFVVFDQIDKENGWRSTRLDEKSKHWAIQNFSL